MLCCRQISLLLVLAASLISHSAAYALTQTGSDCTLQGAQSQPTKINASLILDCFRTGQPIHIRGAEIAGDLDLTLLRQKDSPSIISIATPVTIVESHFTGAVIGADTDQGITVSFEELINFQATIFDGRVNLAGAQFKQAVNFSGTQFKASVDFTQTRFDLSVSFNQASFGGESDFLLTQFSGGADFVETHFEHGVNFLQAQFDKDSDAFFFKTEFNGETFFDQARFAAPAVFMQAKFKGPIQFDGAVFQADASFREAAFHRVQATDTVSFAGASFVTLDLNKAQFETKQLDLSDASYKSLTDLDFNPALLAPPKDMDVHRAMLVNLESNFKSQNLLPLANEIAYQQHILEREAKPPLVQSIEFVFLDMPFGYGLKPSRALITSLIMILVFSIFYYPAGIIRLAPIAPPRPRERRLAMRLSELPMARDDEFPDLVKKDLVQRQMFPRVARAWQAISFSFGVFTKISWGEFVAVKYKTIVLLEWLLGLVMLAGLVFSLTNTNPLLNALFKSIL